MKTRLALLLVILAAGFARTGHSATLTVTTIADSGAGSLRQTVADAAPGDTIVFAAALSGKDITLGGAHILLDKDVTIDAAALLPKGIFISGNGTFGSSQEPGQSRIFEVANGATVLLRGLFLRNGKVRFSGLGPFPATDDNSGGGILNRGQLTLEQCAIRFCRGEYGAGIYNNGGSLTLIQSTLADNEARTRGGGIYSDNGGTVTLTRSFVSGFPDSGGSSGIDTDGGTVTVIQSTLAGISGYGGGGGIRNHGGVVTVTDSTLVRNVGSTTGGGGIYNTDGGTVTLTRSTVEGNSGAVSGGIYNNNGTVTLIQSTLTGNSGAAASGIYNAAGGTVTLTQSTVSGNSGGINNNGGTLHLTRSIVAGNSGANVSGVIATDVNNLLSGDPLLGPPGDYGGLTRTRPPQPGSPVIDAGGTVNPGFATDQRGLARVIGAAVDIGAVEHDPAAPPPPSIIIENANDSGPGSLRAAVAAAAPGATIVFAPTLSGETIFLKGAQILLDKDVTIDASALFDGLAISGTSVIDFFGYKSRHFEVSAGATVHLRGLRLVAGVVPSDPELEPGGAILNFGNLTLEDCTISGCTAGRGGGIYNNGSGTLTLLRSTLLFNVTVSDGGGIYNAPGGVVTLTQSTLADNATGAFGGGGGIYNRPGGTVTLTQSTVSGNSAWFGGGIVNADFPTAPGPLHLTRSIVAGNSGANVSGVIAPAVIATDVNNLLSGDPLLAPAGNYGGPTPTRPPLPGSPAIDAGGPADPGFPTDQRGAPRLIGAAMDLGAVEYDPIPAPTVVENTFDDHRPGSLRAILAWAPPGSVITFIPALSGQTIILGGAQILLNKNLTIDASALPGGIRISGNADINRMLDPGESRLFTVATGATVTLRGLSLIDGQTAIKIYSSFASDDPAGWGAAIHNRGQLTLQQCLIDNCTALFGAAIYTGGGSVTITQSTLSDNGGGDEGININGGGVTITQSTLSGTGITNHAGTLHLTRSIAVWHSLGNVPGPISIDANNNLISGDPRLAPLGDYGGPTWTMPPLPGSPVIDAGGTANPGFATDQRGFPRVIGVAVDIGAVEFGPLDSHLVVTSLDDALDGLEVNGVSLREAVAFSPAGDTITFAPALSGQTITLGGTNILLDKDLIIDASALSGGIAISGNANGNSTLDPGESRIFHVPAGATVTLRGLRLVNGQVSTTVENSTGFGGAILNSGTLTLDRCLIADSRALVGGGIYNSAGILTLTRSTLSGNSAFGGGGIYNVGPLAITQSTFSGNSATFDGGGLYNFAAAAVTLDHCTLSANSASSGSGIYTDDGTTLHLTRSIVAGNTGGNIFGDLASSANNFLSGNPLLAPLGDYGGPTPTMPPLPGSPAIDAAAIDPLLTTDQRGFARPNGPLPDIGAVEAYPFSLLNLPDTDGDGIPNILEGPGGPYPQFTVGIDDSALDSDGDGSPDAAELANMTDPHNPNDYFRLLAFTSAGLSPESNPLFDVTWKSFPGLSYTIVAKTDLNFAASPHAFAPVTATNFTHTLRVELDQNNPQDFIRVRRD